MNTQQMLSRLRKCIFDFKMIREGDKIAVGMSGGKDSLTLLELLAFYKNFSNEKFELIAISIDLGFNGKCQDYSLVDSFCKEKNIKFILEKTDIADVIFNIRKEKNPCSLCSKMRKGALYQIAKENGCNKVALGHHSSDLVHTYLLSMFFEGRLSTFAPKSYLSRTGITIIRPMLYLTEGEIRNYSTTMPIVKNKCPKDQNTKRQMIKEIIFKLGDYVPYVEEKILNALLHYERYSLFDKYHDEIEKF